MQPSIEMRLELLKMALKWAQDNQADPVATYQSFVHALTMESAKIEQAVEAKQADMILKVAN